MRREAIFPRAVLWAALIAGAGRWIPSSVSGLDRLANDLPLDQPVLWLFVVLPGWLAWSVTVSCFPLGELFRPCRSAIRRTGSFFLTADGDIISSRNLHGDL